MPQVQIESDRLLICDPQKSRSSCNIFISRPTPLEEKNLGKLFIITEIETTDKINYEIINIIQEELKENFYNSEELNIEMAFENSLNKVNQKLHELITEGITHWLEKFNIIAAVIKAKNLYLTQVGKMHAFLIHKDRIIDIISQTPSFETKINPLKIFSNIISGELNHSDQLLLCTTSILDYFSQEKLRRMIVSSLPSEAAASLENLLLESPVHTSFAAIIIKLLEVDIANPVFEQENKKVIPRIINAPQSSMEKLIEKERTTAQYLTPSIWPNVGKTLKNIYFPLTNFIRLKILKRPARRTRPEELYRYRARQKEKRLWIKVFNQLFRILKFAAQGIYSFFAAFFGLFKKRREMKTKIKEFPKAADQKISRSISMLQRLTRKQKIILIVALIILFIFAESIVLIGKGQDKKLSAEQIANNINQIQEKTYQAESALSYSDEEGAKKLLAEATDLLNQLPKKSKTDKAKYDELSTLIQAQYVKTKHIIEITDPLVKFDFSNLDPNLNANGLIFSSNNLYVFNSNNEIYKGVISSGKMDKISKTSQDAGQFKLDANQTNNTVLFYHDKDGLLEFNTKTETLKPIEITFANQDKEIRDMYVFESKLYLLDVKNNQIFRHGRAANAYGESLSWIKDPNLNIKDTVSLAIDGSIYVLKSSGVVMELVQGRQVDFSLAEIDPKLTTATKIWTDANSNYLYILDPQGKRLVVFNKKGVLKAQYTSSKFDDLKGFAVDEKNKKLWLQNGLKVFEITLEL